MQNKIKQMYKYLIQKIKWLKYRYFTKHNILKWWYIYKLKLYFSFRQFKKYLHPAEFQKHCLITWMTGSWKSELLKYLIHFFINTQKQKASIIVCDPHGDVADEIFNHKYINHDNVVYFHPLLFDKEHIFGINPFGYKLNDDEIEVYASELALVFEEMIKSSSSLTLNMKSLLVPCITVLLKRENSSLKELQRFMTANNEDLVTLGTKSLNPSIANFFKYNFNDQIYSITKQSISVKIQSLLNSHIFTKITTSNNTVNLKELIDDKKIIIFNLSKWLLGSEVSQALWRFIVALTQSIAISRAKEEKRFRVPTYLFIDEFTNYTTKSIKSILEESRKYHLHLIVATQLLWKNIDPILKESILSNTNVKMIGANAYVQQLSLAKETQIEKNDLLNLRVWNFYIKSKFAKSFLYDVPKIFVWTKYTHSKMIIDVCLFTQFKMYYQKHIQERKEDNILKPLFEIEDNDTKRKITKDIRGSSDI